VKSRAILARQANGVVADPVCNYILLNELKVATKFLCHSYVFYYGINKTQQAVRAVSDAEKTAASGSYLFN
jgi:hypothetical protein